VERAFTIAKLGHRPENRKPSAPKKTAKMGHPSNVSVTLDTIARAARALGKREIIRVANVKVKRA